MIHNHLKNHVGVFLLTGLSIFILLSPANIFSKRNDTVTSDKIDQDRYPPPSRQEFQRNTDINVKFDKFEENNKQLADLKLIENKPNNTYNKNFIFHNKLPKCGSTTLLAIVRILSEKNGFTLLSNNDNNEILGKLQKTDELELSKLFKSSNPEKAKKTFLIRHHFPFNFEKYGFENPTYINVIREPSSWFQSHYYFKRFGRGIDKNKKVQRGQNLKDKIKSANINTCVENNHRECSYLDSEYFRFLGGDYISDLPNFKKLSKAKDFDAKHFRSYHSNPSKNEKDRKLLRKMLKATKISLLKRFHVVGILEDFEVTLKLFEAMMPEYFQNVMGAYKSSTVSDMTKQSASLNVSMNSKLTDENKLILKTGLLKYETDLYEFAKVLFYHQVKLYL